MEHRHIRRTYLSKAIYFITTNVWHQRPFFRNPNLARMMERSIWHERTSRFIVHAYVVMPDHLHALFQPTKGTISSIMKSIKENSSRDINKDLHRHSGDGAVAAIRRGERFQWQKSFYDHVIRDERDFINHVEYIRYNPVKAGLVDKPEEYPFLFVDEDAVSRAPGL